MLTVVFGGLWVQRQLDHAKDERCQLAFAQVKLLVAELKVLEPTLDAKTQADVEADVQQAINWVVGECGVIPAS